MSNKKLYLGKSVPFSKDLEPHYGLDMNPLYIFKNRFYEKRNMLLSKLKENYFLTQYLKFHINKL